eukprot:364896-Chlamydomonas_euryale.AAC.13
MDTRIHQFVPRSYMLRPLAPGVGIWDLLIAGSTAGGAYAGRVAGMHFGVGAVSWTLGVQQMFNSVACMFALNGERWVTFTVQSNPGCMHVCTGLEGLQASMWMYVAVASVACRST